MNSADKVTFKFIHFFINCFLGNAFVTSFNDRINSPAPRTIYNEEFNASVDSLFSPVITASASGSLLQLSAESTTLLQVNTTVSNDPRTSALNGLEHLVNDDSALADHDVITLLAGNPDEAIELGANNQETSNQSSSSSRQNSNRNRTSARRTINVVHEIENSDNPTLIATYRIISKYLPGQPVAFSISDRLATLPLTETISLSGLLTMTSAKIRPNREEQLQMIEELVSSCLYSVTRPRQNAFIIKRISNDQQNQ